MRQKTAASGVPVFKAPDGSEATIGIIRDPTVRNKRAVRMKSEVPGIALGDYKLDDKVEKIGSTMDEILAIQEAIKIKKLNKDKGKIYSFTSFKDTKKNKI